MKLRPGWWIILIACLLLLADPLWSQADTSCVRCHGDVDLVGDEGAQIVQHYAVDIHRNAGISCHNCHGGNPDPALAEDMAAAMDPAFKPNPYRGAPDRLDIPGYCGTCHSDPEYMRRFRPDPRVDQEREYWTSRHGEALRKGDPNVATCIDCHGIHGIRSVEDVESRVFPKNVADTCAGCHSDPDRMGGYQLADGRPIPTNQRTLWLRSVHASAMLEKEDLSAPTCNDCHGNHGATPPGLESISFVCGQCHGREARLFRNSPKHEGFREHATFLEEAPDLGCQGCHELPGEFEQIAPVHSVTECATCHGNHGVVRPTISMLGPLPGTPCEFCHRADGNEAAGGLPSEHPERFRQTLDGLLSQAEQIGVDGDARYDWLVGRTLELPMHTLEGPADVQPRLRPEFARLFEKFRIGTLRVASSRDDGSEEPAWRVRCTQCHDSSLPDNPSTVLASEFVGKIVRLTGASATAERALLEARRGGVETREALAEIEQAVAAGIELQVLVHTFSAEESGEFDSKFREGMTSAEAALEAGITALGELRSRRLGLFISLIFIGLTLVGLYFKIRQVG